MLCVIHIGFYGNLLCSTLGLVLVVMIMLATAYTASKRDIRDTMQSKWAIGAFYLLLFAYPGEPLRAYSRDLKTRIMRLDACSGGCESSSHFCVS